MLALAGLALLGGLWAALVRVGWPLPNLPLPVAGQHGALMISGFLGTLISLERAVALQWRPAFVPPLLSGLGMLGLMLGLPIEAGRALITLGAFGLVLVFIRIVRRQPATFTVVMGLGALMWLVGDGLWLMRRPLPQVVLWWMGFLVLTIAGERLELGRLLRPGRWAHGTFLAALALLIAGAALAIVSLALGWAIAGLGAMGLGVWLLANDIARRTVRQTGLPRYIAVCLLLGYGWLSLGGLAWLAFAAQTDSSRHYDVMLHSVLLGFVFSMIFGHAPIILPSLFARPPVYSPMFYGPLAGLHLALAVRLLGDLGGLSEWRLWGGLFNVLTIPLFIGLWLVVMARSRVTVARPR